ncbi:MAG: SDR family NAD(P)-dependent oxidoreductase [archaeon]
MTISIVTGASSGLGRNIAKRLSKKGHTVYVVARSKDKLKELQKECNINKGKIKIVSGDLSDEKFRKRLINTVLKNEKKINYLINNAGFGRAQDFSKEPYQEMVNMFNLNVLGYAHLTQLAIIAMKRRKKGRIINVSSVVNYTPLPYFAIYNATKAAISNMTKSLYYELEGTGVSISAVHPARMKTKFAHRAYDCYKGKHSKDCIKKFNKLAGDSDKVAKFIVRKLDSKKMFMFPTFRAKILHLLYYIPFLIHLSTKYTLTKQARKDLKI